MHIIITGRRVNLKDTFKERVRKKLLKFARFFDDDTRAYVTVTADKSRQTVEIAIKNAGTVYRAEKTSHDMQYALDSAVDGLMRQIHKNKARLEKRLRAGIAETAPGKAGQAGDGVVKVRTIAAKPMSVDEAILQMNLEGHEIFTFLNDATGLVNVVYRRRDGAYGVLEPMLA